MSVGVMTVGVMTVGVMTVGVMTVGVMTVGVMTVGVMRRPHCSLLLEDVTYIWLKNQYHKCSSQPM